MYCFILGNDILNTQLKTMEYYMLDKLVVSLNSVNVFCVDKYIAKSMFRFI